MLLAPPDEGAYEAVTAPLWTFLDGLTPNLWRQGRAYPQTGPRQFQLIADDEIDLAISFSPGEASTAIANRELPDTVRTYVMDGGTIGNASFVAIPYNSGAKEGAMVVADFLLSPEAQARALDPAVLGYGTVLDVAALPEEDRALFRGDRPRRRHADARRAGAGAARAASGLDDAHRRRLDRPLRD